jgi:hypothetical protein
MDTLCIEIIEIIFRYCPNECKSLNKEFYSCSTPKIKNDVSKYLTDNDLSNLSLETILKKNII